MLTHGQDRARRAGDKVILQSAISKGWTPRTPKSLSHAEFPGTAVMWGEECFEVIEAAATPSGGVRYVLAAWRDDHTIRTFESYDADAEALRIADHERARRQRRAGKLASLSGVVLGHLPGHVQRHFESELGIRATRMTMVSCVPALVVFGIAAYLHVDAMLRQELSVVPPLLWPLLALFLFDSGIRFFVVMSQDRPMGSIFGLIGYAIYSRLSSKRQQLPPVIGGRGESVAFTAPSEDVALRGSFEVKEPLLTLLTPAEQTKLAERFGFDYRRTAFAVAWAIFVCAAIGAAASKSVLGMLVAGLVAIEQLWRLVALRRGPVGCVFGVLVRLVTKDLFR